MKARAAELEESGTEADVNGDLQQAQASLEILHDQLQATGRIMDCAPSEC